jgi:hypothetical protein
MKRRLLRTWPDTSDGSRRAPFWEHDEIDMPRVLN